MTKQTKTLLGLAVLAGVGYYAYTQFSKPKSNFANLAPNCQKNPRQCPCNGGEGGDGCPNKKDSGVDQNGKFYEICKV